MNIFRHVFVTSVPLFTGPNIKSFIKRTVVPLCSHRVVQPLQSAADAKQADAKQAEAPGYPPNKKETAPRQNLCLGNGPLSVLSLFPLAAILLVRA